jgi:hypothetical protein
MAMSRRCSSSVCKPAAKTNLQTVEFLPRPCRPGTLYWLRQGPTKTDHFFAGVNLCSLEQTAAGALGTM